MLNQVIYTRSFPHRDIKKHGNMILNEGYGIFSMTSQLFEDMTEDDLKYIDSRMSHHNASSENSKIGMFESYEYVLLPSGQQAIISDTPRTLCKVPRVSGATHRPGNYIKQMLAGELKGYPIQWVGATNFDAAQKSENDYYLDNYPDLIPWLSKVNNVPQEGNISLKRVKEFLSAGRQETFKKILAYILFEFDKAIEDRKVLLIKDTAENVSMWIGAIQYVFLEDMAKEITFNTSKKNLKQNSSMALYYYISENSEISFTKNPKLLQKRRYHCMIVGYHPDDDTSNSIKAYQNSDYVILDGTTNNFSVEIDVDNDFYTAALEYSPVLRKFEQYVLSEMRISTISSKIVDIYNACNYLLATRDQYKKWEYNDALKSIEVVLQFYHKDIKPGQVLYAIVEYLMLAYERFVKEDIRNSGKMLTIMYERAKQLSRELIAESQIERIFNDVLYQNDKRTIIDFRKCIQQVWENSALCKKIDMNLFFWIANNSLVDKNSLSIFEPERKLLSKNDFINYLNYIENNELSQDIILALVVELDKMLSYDTENNVAFDYYRVVNNLLLKIGVTNLKDLFNMEMLPINYTLVTSQIYLSSISNEEVDSSDMIEIFNNLHLIWNDDLYQDEYIKRIIRRILELKNGKMHLYLLSLCKSDERVILDNIVKSYIGNVISCSHDRYKLDAIFSLAEASMILHDNENQQTVIKNINIVIFFKEAVINEMSRQYSKNLYAAINEYTYKEDNTINDYLEKMLKQINERQVSSIEKTISNVFKGVTVFWKKI